MAVGVAGYGSTTVIDLRDSAKMVDGLRAKRREAAIRGVRRAAAKGLRVLTTKIIPSRNPKPVDRGVYRAAWKLESLPNGAAIYNDEPHAKFIEYGVRAANVRISAAMIQALTEWVLRKRLGGKGKGKGKKGKDPVAAARQIAWAIAKNAKAKSGLAFFAGPRGDGYQVLRELRELHLPSIIKEEVGRELAKVKP